MVKLIYLKRLLPYVLARVFYKRRLARLFGVQVSEIEALYREILSSAFRQDRSRKADMKMGFIDLSMASVLRAPTLYVLCRLLKPETVVETGVADGFSSAFILKALEKNGKGRLYSIDLPNEPGQEVARGKTTGWLVPEDLKARWRLILGSSREKLPALLSELKQIDIFYHDSDHSYENMMFEFKKALPYVKEDGLILSDDITDNDSFGEFCASIKSEGLELFKLGIIRVEQ